MANVSVLFFGPLSDAVGSKELIVGVEPSTSVHSLVDQLKSQHASLTDRRLLVAVNQEYATADLLLNDGDEVAIFTPVSGG